MNNEAQNHVLDLKKLMSPCRLCPRACGANRFSGAKGVCGAGSKILVSSYNLHHSEEPPVSGTRGSGTIFFAGCSLSCVFCQNYPISQLRHGNPVSVERLAEMMLELQDKGAHNINFVTPTHFTAQIAEASLIARSRGLSVPLLYNTSGYDSVEALRLLEGIIDIYMPDMKYCSEASAQKYSGAGDYVKANRLAVREMYRQAGHLVMDAKGIAFKGLIIRHLVLPGNIAGSLDVLRFIAKELSADIYLSVMAQYHPANKAERYPELSQKVTKQEYGTVLDELERLGFENGWTQELD